MAAIGGDWTNSPKSVSLKFSNPGDIRVNSPQEGYLFVPLLPPLLSFVLVPSTKPPTTPFLRMFPGNVVLATLFIGPIWSVTIPDCLHHRRLPSPITPQFLAPLREHLLRRIRDRIGPHVPTSVPTANPAPSPEEGGDAEDDDQDEDLEDNEDQDEAAATKGEVRTLRWELTGASAPQAHWLVSEPYKIPPLGLTEASPSTALIA